MTKIFTLFTALLLTVGSSARTINNLEDYSLDSNKSSNLFNHSPSLPLVSSPNVTNSLGNTEEEQFCPAVISALDCNSMTSSGSLYAGVAASSVSFNLSYSGGNGGSYIKKNFSSTGATGLTATIEAGDIATGSGIVTYNITGTATSTGIATFDIKIGGKSCIVNLTVGTAVVDVTSIATGKTWMDRNVGAARAATSSTDAASYGDLYQWGRGSDGHQYRTSGKTNTLSSSNTPGHGDFIFTYIYPDDWRSPQNNNLWQGVSGVNNPCPSGYRLPTYAELDAERASWSTANAAGAFASPLKLPKAGARASFNGDLSSVGIAGHYWSSDVSGTSAGYLAFGDSNAFMTYLDRAYGYSVRCMKNITPP